MKKNRFMRLASILLVLVMITCCAISGTLAKYTKTIDGESDTARVAIFNVHTVVDATKPIFQLTGDILDEAAITANADYLTADTADEDIWTRMDKNPADKGGNREKLVAPGTWGKFNPDVVNYSEVTVKVVAQLKELPVTDIPLQIGIYDATTSGVKWFDLTATGVLDAINAALAALPVTLKAGEKISTQTTVTGNAVPTVYWRWVFEKFTDVQGRTLESAANIAAADGVDTALAWTGTDYKYDATANSGAGAWLKWNPAGDGAWEVAAAGEPYSTMEKVTVTLSAIATQVD